MLKIKSWLSVGSRLIVLAAVLWALDGVLRRSLYSLPPVIIVFYEHLIGAGLLLVFYGKEVWQAREKIFKKNFLLLVGGISLLSGLLGTLWFTTALVRVNFIPLSVVLLLQKLQPLFAISSARLLLKEKVASGFVKWAVLAMAAAFLVTFPRGQVNWVTGSGTIVAAVYAVAAAAAWGIGTSLSKLMLKQVSHRVASTLRFSITTVFALLAVVLLGVTTSLTTPDLSQYLRFIMIALSTGMVALFIYYKGLKQVKAQVSTILELVFPVLAVFIDAVLYHSVLDWTQYLAAGVLVYAIIQVGQPLKISKEV